MGLALYSVYLIIVCIDWFSQYVVQNCEHDRTWHDENEHSHIRASLVGPIDNYLQREYILDRHMQQIVEMDIKERKRKIILQIVGE